jgi:hypothetical protein
MRSESGRAGHVEFSDLSPADALRTPKEGEWNTFLDQERLLHTMTKAEASSTSSTTPYHLHQSTGSKSAHTDSKRNASSAQTTRTTIASTASTSSSRRDAILRDLALENPEYRYYMTEYALSRIDTDETLSDDDVMVIQRLACRKFHMPGNTFWQDYIYWYGVKRV